MPADTVPEVLTGVHVILLDPVGPRAQRPALRMLLEAAGCSVEAASDRDATLDPGSVLFMRGTPTLFPHALRRLREGPARDRPIVVLWHQEPLPPPRISGLPAPLRLPRRSDVGFALGRPVRVTRPSTNLETVCELARAGLLDVLAVSTLWQRQVLEEHGLPSHFVPIGWEPALGKDLRGERDIDILVLGDARVARRRLVLARLRARGVVPVVAGDWSPGRGVWGAERMALLNRARILLSIPRQRGWFAGLRFLLGMANGALVVSEDVYAPAPYVPGTHFVSAPVRELPGVLHRYLADEEARARIAEQARLFVTTELTMERSVARLVELIANVLTARSAPEPTR
jgi:hypothetical protein